MVEDDPDLGEGVDEKGDEVGVGGPDVEPEDVILLGGVTPDRKGVELPDVDRGERIGRAAYAAQPEADYAPVPGEPVHVVFRRSGPLRDEPDPGEAAGPGAQAVPQVAVVLEFLASCLHQHGAVDAVLLHQAEQLFGRLLPFGGPPLADLARILVGLAGEHVDVRVYDHGFPAQVSHRNSRRRSGVASLSASPEKGLSPFASPGFS